MLRSRLFSFSNRFVSLQFSRGHRHLWSRKHLASAMDITHLSQQEATAVDEELMGSLGFSIDQLMELAGLSCAAAINAEYARETHPRCLILAGPGNNGGDGLVCARHLTHFGYQVEICYPKRTAKPLYDGLVQQCTSLGMRFLEPHELSLPLAERYDVVVDALFGFSFRGEPRPPFDALLDHLRPAARPPSLVSIDIPSGWHVELGDEQGNGLQPDMLISLTAPKLCARSFKGAHHYLGGRFVPPAIKNKYNLKLPEYPGASMCVKIKDANAPVSPADMRVSYDKFTLSEESVSGDPFRQFGSWFAEAAACADITEPNAMALATATGDGAPSVRMVLLKSFDERGFVFYTNFDSRKGAELRSNPRAAFTMWWEPLQRAVRVEGAVEPVSDEEAEQYFGSRPLGSKIGAWASAQSSVVASREALEAKEAEVAARFSEPGATVPKPPNWGGFRIAPTKIEFWQGRPSRLHDRIECTWEPAEQSWRMRRLCP